MTLGISIILCCYNSRSRLYPTLEHLANQKGKEDLSIELILVDNCSTDDTASYAKEVWNKLNSPFPFFIVHESEPGLSNARKAGILAASKSLLLFCDDDNWLAPDYLIQAATIMKAKPNIGCLGGYNEAVSNVTFPTWFAHFEQAYACGAQGKVEGWDKSRLYINGAGMILRKEVLQRLEKSGFRSLLSDRKGQILSSGGDSELSIATIVVGFQLYYSPKLKLKHFMPPERLTWPYLVKMYRGHACANYVLSFYYDLFFNRPIKKMWFSETLIRCFYFFKYRGVVNIIKWSFANQKKGDITVIDSLWKTERLLAHLKNTEYNSIIKTIKNFIQQARLSWPEKNAMNESSN